MLELRLVAILLAVELSGLATGTLNAQDYPTKPIRIIASPGGANDFIARLIARGIGERMGWQFIVDNRPSGFIQGEALINSNPDGYTALMAAGTFTTGPLLEKAPYDVVKDFAPVTLVATSPSVLVVNPTLPATSVKDLIAVAKAKPGQLNYATSGSGGAAHLPAELLKVMAGIDIVRINYKGAGQSLTALLSGEVHLLFATAPSAAPHLKSGKLRALAVTSAQPSVLLPGMPTVAASLPGYEFVSPFGVYVPARTPPTIIDRMNQAIVKVIHQPDIKQKFLESGSEVVGNTPEQYRAVIKSELATWDKVIKQAGIRVN